MVLDMEAGLEHMGRGTTEGMDQFIVVIEPGSRSVQTYKNVKRLAKDLGVKQVHVVVANKIRDEKDEEFVKTQYSGRGSTGIHSLQHGELWMRTVKAVLHTTTANRQ